MQRSIEISEYKALSREFNDDRPILVSVELIEQDDLFPDNSYLETEFDEQAQTITNSCRYTNEDVAKYGWEKVKTWIDADRARLNTFGVNWTKVGIMAKAVVVIPTSKGLHFFRDTIESMGCWGIDSDHEDRMREIGSEELLDLRYELNKLNVVVPDALRGALDGVF